MTTLADIAAWVDVQDDAGVLIADGFEDAFIGIAQRCGQPSLAVFDVELCLDIIESRDGCTRDEAIETFEFNTLGSWVGDLSPLYLFRFPRGEKP